MYPIQYLMAKGSGHSRTFRMRDQTAGESFLCGASFFIPFRRDIKVPLWPFALQVSVCKLVDRKASLPDCAI